MMTVTSAELRKSFGFQVTVPRRAPTLAGFFIRLPVTSGG